MGVSEGSQPTQLVRAKAVNRNSIYEFVVKRKAAIAFAPNILVG
jgi:hypothetical protein